MHPEPKLLLKRAISEALPILHPLLKQHQSPCLVWTKRSESSWNGEWVSQPDLSLVFIAADKIISKIGAAFIESFFAQHPEYKGFVGVAGCGQLNLAHARDHILGSAISCFWNRQKSFIVNDEAIDRIVDEFETFVDSSMIKLDVRTVLRNFLSSSDDIALRDDLRLRRMTDAEYSALHGGSIHHIQTSDHDADMHSEFWLETSAEARKAVGSDQDEGDAGLLWNTTKELLDTVILALRTFKAGPVGYGMVHFQPKTFCPITVPSYWAMDFGVPARPYKIDTEEIAALQRHLTHIPNMKDDAMRLACSRLADAAVRFRPHDRIIDAVIGMEAILLAPIEDRGELSFRFSMNYAMLFPLAERVSAFQTARSLYSLRSLIAHGNRIRDKDRKIADRQVSLDEAGQIATEALRKVITFFLPMSELLFNKSEFWTSQYFTLPNVDVGR